MEEFDSLDCFGSLQELAPIGGGGVPAEEVQNMVTYQEQSWLRMEQCKQNVSTGKSRAITFIVSDEDDPDRVLWVAENGVSLWTKSRMNRVPIAKTGTVVKHFFFVKPFFAVDSDLAPLHAEATMNASLFHALVFRYQTSVIDKG